MDTKVILITGASSGMGAASSLYFANNGWSVVAGARTVDRIPKHKNILAVKLDVSDPESNKNFVNIAIEKFGRIDVLINNAGYGEYGPTEEIKMESAKYQFEVNYFAAVEISNLVLPIMRDQRSGRIINVSSVGGDTYVPLGAHYYASKAALQQWSDTLDTEIRPFGLRSVIVQPGNTESAWSSTAHKRSLANLDANSPYRKMVEGINKSFFENVKFTATANDLAKLFYKIATAKNPKRRNFNKLEDRLTVWVGRAIPGIIAMVMNRMVKQNIG